MVTDDYDFKGNPLGSERQLAREYATTLDWSAEVLLESVAYTSRSRYDALNRPIQWIAPHGDPSRINVVQTRYNQASLLKQVSAWLDQDALPTELLDPPTADLSAVTAVDYDAKGQRTRIDYGNGVRSTYSYDPLTYRLVHLEARRDAADYPADCPQPAPAGWPGCQVQNLHYTYDPVGNITHRRDDAQQTVFFRNRRVDPSCEYTYDAIYRLIEATGREHLGQIGAAPSPHSYDDAGRVGLLHPGDGNATGTYLERYVYDMVGNILEMRHRGSDPAHPGWTRRYDYSEPSLIEPIEVSNRLSSTVVGANNPQVESYDYDVHGNVTRMPHLGAGGPGPNLYWDFRDRLRQADLGGGGTAYYVYDSTGQRVRKVWEKPGGIVEERLYLGGLEVFRRSDASGTVSRNRSRGMLQISTVCQEGWQG